MKCDQCKQVRRGNGSGTGRAAVSPSAVSVYYSPSWLNSVCLLHLWLPSRTCLIIALFHSTLLPRTRFKALHNVAARLDQEISLSRAVFIHIYHVFAMHIWPCWPVQRFQPQQTGRLRTSGRDAHHCAVHIRLILWFPGVAAVHFCRLTWFAARQKTDPVLRVFMSLAAGSLHCLSMMIYFSDGSHFIHSHLMIC